MKQVWLILSTQQLGNKVIRWVGGGVGKELILRLFRLSQSSRAGDGTELGKILDAQHAETLAS